MDIKKYLKNKDVELTDEDFDLERLTSDLRKGYVVEKDLRKQFEDELAEKTKEYTTKIASMQNDYDSLNTKYSEQTGQVKASNLKVAILSNGFRSEDVDQVSKLRTNIYGEITDDFEALNKVKEQYGKVFFDNKVDTAPNETPMQTTPSEEPKPVITRNTSIKELMK